MPLEQLQPPNIVNWAHTSWEEVIILSGQISDAESYLGNSDKLRVTSLQLEEQLKLSQIEVNNGIENLLQVEGTVEGYKLKIKAFEIERDSLESEHKTKISEGRRKMKKLHTNLKTQTFAKYLLWKRMRLHDSQRLFSPPRASLIYYCCRK